MEYGGPSNAAVQRNLAQEMAKAIPKPTINLINPQDLADAFAPIIAQFSASLDATVEKAISRFNGATLTLPPPPASDQ